MTDKYEEFKEWLNNLNAEDGVQIRVVEKREWWSVTELFFHYEAEQILREQEKQREKEIKKVITDYMPVNSEVVGTQFHKSCVDKIYDELKEKGLIK